MYLNTFVFDPKSGVHALVTNLPSARRSRPGVSVCVYLCVFVSVSVCLNLYVCLCVHALVTNLPSARRSRLYVCIYIYIYIYIYMCVYVCVCVCVSE